jgi:hypothetical protein
MKKKFLKDEKYEIRAFFKKALISQFRCKDTLYFCNKQIFRIIIFRNGIKNALACICEKIIVPLSS